MHTYTHTDTYKHIYIYIYMYITPQGYFPRNLNRLLYIYKFTQVYYIDTYEVHVSCIELGTRPLDHAPTWLSPRSFSRSFAEASCGP